MRLAFLLRAVTSGLLVAAPPALAQFRHQLGVKIPMRDRVRLSADLWLPAAAGRYPIILVRTPYLKTNERADRVGQYFAKNGYVYVIQDVRGRGDSEGTFGFWFQEIADGYDTVEWLAAQPWSNGRIGMTGSSYLGSTQWLAAKDRPPHLSCIIPIAPGGRYFDDVPFQGGAFLMSWGLPWINGTSERISQWPNATGIDWNKIWAHRPLSTADSVMGRIMPLYREVLQHTTMDAYWKRLHFDTKTFQRLNLPVLHVTGWFDAEQLSSLFYWEGMRAHSPAKDKQYLLIGPWTHGSIFGNTSKVGEMEFPTESIVDGRALALAFYDYCLRDGSFSSPRARIYVTGVNQWRDLDDYPIRDVENRRLYLSSTGSANSLSGDGRLTWTTPGAEQPDRYVYDPKNPVSVQGLDDASDHRPIQRRDDVLVYTTEELTEPLEVIGRIFVTLFAASDARDTDFIANLIDVYPDGRAVVLGPKPGILRARYRTGYEREVLLTPGKVEQYQIELYELGHVFLPGHRIRVEITSSAYPSLNPNQNTGNPIASDTAWKTAHQTVYHDRTRPSYIGLPVPAKH